MNNTVKGRLILFLKHKSLSQRMFSDRVGLSSGYVNAIKNSIQSSTLYRIAEQFPELNIIWLLTGEGEMLKDIPKIQPNAEASEEKQACCDMTPYLIKYGTKYYKLSNGRFKLLAPFVAIRVYADYVTNFRDMEFVETLHKREFYVDEIHQGRYLSFEIKGDSMDDDSKRSLSSKDVVLVREFPRELWQDGLCTQEFSIWILVLKNTILCKQIVNQNQQRGIITCHSLSISPEYCDFDLRLNDIRQIFQIIKKESEY